MEHVRHYLIILVIHADVAIVAAMHGDIKPSNVLVFHEDERLVVKLIDFGYSSMFCEDLESLINVPISIPWYAPELKNHSGSFSILEAKKTDIFSFGVFAMWVLFGNASLESTNGSVSDKELIDGSENMSQDRWIQHIEECKSQDGLVQVACELLARSEEIETRHKGWIKSLFEKALPCNATEREGSMVALLSDLKDNEYVQ
jgi:serine/threonine protein kinase